jgi:tyrosinase
MKKSISEYQAMITDYVVKVQARLATQDGISDYLKLAESRRRIYRPVPLDEFAFTLPWAWLWPHERPLEMTPDGTIREISDRGKKFFDEWIGTLRSANPVIIPRPDAHDKEDRTPAATLQINTEVKTLNMALPCAASRLMSKSQGGCPFARTNKSYTRVTSGPSPTWDDDILALFERPYWVKDFKNPCQVGREWIQEMKYYGSVIPPDAGPEDTLSLDNYAQVKYQAITIYQHVASRSMPITSDPNDYWPTEALEIFRLWINQGCRKTRDDAVVYKERIGRQTTEQATFFRTRKDIRNLTALELQTYRSKLLDVLQVDKLNSKWQELGKLRECQLSLITSRLTDK